MNSKCPDSPKRDQINRIKKNTQKMTNIKDIYNKLSDDLDFDDNPFSFRNTKLDETDYKNLDFEFNDSNLDTSKQKELLKSPKRNSTIRMSLKDKKATNLLNDLRQNILEADDNDINLNDNNDDLYIRNESKCPPSPKKNIPNKIRMKEKEASYKNNLVSDDDRFNSLDDLDDDFYSSPSEEIKNIQKQELPKSPKRNLKNKLIQNTENLSNLKDITNFNIDENKLSRSDNINEFFISKMPDSPKKTINKKIKLNSENVIKEITNINCLETHEFIKEEIDDDDTPKLPMSPKKDLNKKIKNKDLQAINHSQSYNPRVSQEYFLSFKKNKEDSIFSLNDNKSEDEGFDASTKFNSNKVLIDKMKVMEGKIINLEKELKLTKSLIDKKNIDLNNNFSKQQQLNDQQNKERKMLELRIHNLESDHKNVYNEAK